MKTFQRCLVNITRGAVFRRTVERRELLPLGQVMLLAYMVGALGCAADLSAIQSAGLSAIGVNSHVDSHSRHEAASRAESPTVRGVDSKVPELLGELASGRRLDLNSVLSNELYGRDEALARVERGRLAQLLGEGQISVSEFSKAVDIIKGIDDRAMISIRDIGAHAVALVVNDNMIPYEPAGFERVLVFHFQALNYLMDGKLEDAGVEVRRANAEQEVALKAHERELADAEAEAKEHGFHPSAFTSGVLKSLGNSKQVAALVKNSFQNAYTFYMSAVVHEAMNEANDAYIDYKKALEIAPTNTIIQRDVARLAKALSMEDDKASFSRRFPSVYSAARDADKAKIEVVVFFEDGVVPGKEAIRFPIPIPIPGAPGLTSMAIPTFKTSVAPVRPLVLKVGGTEVARSQRICAIDALAVKAYEESATAMIARQVVRASIKGAASSVASKYVGTIAGLATGTLGVATEIADTRSWRSLPQNAQVLRTVVAPGASVKLVHQGTGAAGALTLPSQGGKRVVVRATRIGSKLFLSSVVL